MGRSYNKSCSSSSSSNNNNNNNKVGIWSRIIINKAIVVVDPCHSRVEPLNRFKPF